MNVTLLLVGLAAAAPDRVGLRYVADGASDVAVSPDGAWVAVTTAGGIVAVDTATWDDTAFDVCSSAQGLAATSGDDGGARFFVGCDDGLVRVVEISADGAFSLSDDTFDPAESSVLAVETDGEWLYAVVDRTEGNPTVASFSLTDGSVRSGWPVVLGQSNVYDTALTESYLLVAHGNDDVSKVTVGAAAAVLPIESLGGRSFVDLWAPSDTQAFAVDDGGGIARFNTGTTEFDLLYDEDDVLGAVGGSASDGWCMIGSDTDVTVRAFDTSIGAEESSIADVGGASEIVVADGRAYASTDTDELVVLTEAPWVTLESMSPSEVAVGDTVAARFSADAGTSWELRVGGDMTATGALLASGDLDAGTAVDASFQVTSAFTEGANRVWVFVKDGSFRGHDAGSVSVQSPPGAVPFGQDALGFGDGQLTVRFTALDVTDIDKYTIYVTTTPFTAADWPTGGPAFDGSDDIDAPIEVTAEAGREVVTTLRPLTNDTTYYVAVRAIDTGGLEGPMSDVRSATPLPTYSAAELAGEQGGLCGLPLRSGLGALALAASFVLRRRRAAIAALAAMTVAAVPSAAQARPLEVRQNLQLRYGPVVVADPYYTEVFGEKGTERLDLEYGASTRFVELGAGVAFVQEMGFLLASDGTVSDEHDMFTVFPFTVDATLRLDLMRDETQPLVPFGRLGGDLHLWRENWYVPEGSTTESARSGGKLGWHWAAGGALRLDTLDPTAASELEARAGIRDTFLVWEYRSTQMIHGEDQLDLSTQGWTLGLKLDY